MTINLYNNYSKEILFDFEKIIKTIEEGLKEEKEISLILVDLDEITKINREYRGLDRPTDVISFEESDEC